LLQHAGCIMLSAASTIRTRAAALGVQVIREDDLVL
jgi:hypothetical protein